MKRNALFPYILIMVFGVGLIVALSLIGLYSGNEEAEGEKDSDSALSEATPEEIYSQAGCISCHGENYEGVSGPELKNVDTRLSAEEVKNVLVNGSGPMPGNLVPEEKLDEMVEWVLSLE
ncbi:cytochrome c550 [Pallidibacillus thermolactis]|jgi:cytochrome c550|uniref:cytochrome c550 n=1 Tax=Pallidibacillus thermolactis TaxID=251051 RepID=UPI00156B5923|nr:cytochrome c [Pallidibacillus thermolactis]MED1674343.1 cytochrome c [Pallidibacillus thermolactis subsp. kokeshiiformis]